MKKLNTLAIAVALFGSTLFANVAEAHAKLQSSMPTANSTTASPKAIMLHFNEKMAAKLSAFDLTMADGMKVDLTSTVDSSGLMMTAKLAKPLAPGVYKVTWHAVTSDGHRVSGEYNFTVK